MLDLMMKCNGLHAGTIFYEYQRGRENIEWHEHPDTGELVIMSTWYIQGSDEDDVDHDFEVLGVYPPASCFLAKLNVPFMVNGVHKLNLKTA